MKIINDQVADGEGEEEWGCENASMRNYTSINKIDTDPAIQTQQKVCS